MQHMFFEKVIMVLPPPPHTFICRRCGWTRTVAPRSDALMPGEWVLRCPVCGNDELSSERAGPLATVGSLARRALDGLRKKPPRRP